LSAFKPRASVYWREPAASVRWSAGRLMTAAVAGHSDLNPP